MITRVEPFFDLYDSQGVPLDVIFECFLARGSLPDWIDFFVRAMRAGWNPFPTFGKLKEAVEMVYDADFVAAWTLRMKLCLTQILPIEVTS